MNGPRCFERDMLLGVVKCFAKFTKLLKNHWLSARYHNVLCGPFRGGRDDVIYPP